MHIRLFHFRPACKLGMMVMFLLLSISSIFSAENMASIVPISYEQELAPILKPEPSIFPSIYFTDNLNKYRMHEESKPYWVSSDIELSSFLRKMYDDTSILLNTDILAYYGHPLSKNMGILGWYSVEELDEKRSALAEEYEQLDENRNIQKAFYIIYGTVWPEGEIGILRDSVLLKYIEYALEHDILVFVDHQIGRFDPIDSLKTILPYLRYPNVHLALDPEWRTDKPMEEIGRVTAAELNEAQEVMEQYMIANNIPGERLLVIHQFNSVMIQNRTEVKTDFERVRLVHCADGFGPPAMKRESYKANSWADNIPVKGFKLFYNSGREGAGYDNPLLTPEEVLGLEPRPYVIMYQ
jgi:uncharacterized small protein (DUF1192 family)